MLFETEDDISSSRAAAVKHERCVSKDCLLACSLAEDSTPSKIAASLFFFVLWVDDERTSAVACIKDMANE